MTSGCDNIGSGNPCIVGVIACLILYLSVSGTYFVGVLIYLSVLDTIESGYMFLTSVCFVLLVFLTY